MTMPAAVLRHVVVERPRALHLADDGAGSSRGGSRARRGSSAGRPRRSRRARRPRRSGRRRRRRRCRRRSSARGPRAMRSRRFSATVGSGWWFGKRPSGSQKSSCTSCPSARKIGSAATPARAVAGVDRDPQLPRRRGSARSRTRRTSAITARSSRPPAGLGHEIAGGSTISPIACGSRAPWIVLVPDADLETVVGSRIVARRDHHAAVHAPSGSPRSRGAASAQTPMSVTSSPRRASPRSTARGCAANAAGSRGRA